MARLTDEFYRAVQQASEQFTESGADLTVSEKKFDAYLAATDGQSSPNRADRLMLLAMQCAKFGWEFMSQIYEHIARTEPFDQQLPALINWQASGFEYFMTEKGGFSIEERCRVAEDLDRVLRHALEVSPKNGGIACSYGELYLEHPRRPQDEHYYLTKALEWLEFADDWSQGIDDQAYSTLILLADTYYRLQRWNDALVAFQRLKQLHQKLQIDSDLTEVEERMIQCSKELRH